MQKKTHFFTPFFYTPNWAKKRWGITIYILVWKSCTSGQNIVNHKFRHFFSSASERNRHQLLQLRHFFFRPPPRGGSGWGGPEGSKWGGKKSIFLSLFLSKKINFFCHLLTCYKLIADIDWLIAMFQLDLNRTPPTGGSGIEMGGVRIAIRGGPNCNPRGPNWHSDKQFFIPSEINFIPPPKSIFYPLRNQFFWPQLNI